MLQRGTIQILHHEEGFAALLADVVDRADVWMVQCRRGFRLATKPLQRLPILRQIFREKFQRDEASEPGVLGLVDDTHAAAAEFLDDPVVRDGLIQQGSPRTRGEPC